MLSPVHTKVPRPTGRLSLALFIVLGFVVVSVAVIIHRSELAGLPSSSELTDRPPER
jgi:hypothetical protein